MEKELENRLNKIGEDINTIKVDIVDVKEDLKEAKKERAELKVRIDETYNAVDGFIKVVTKLEQEFTIMKKDVDKIKEVIKEKLGVDLF